MTADGNSYVFSCVLGGDGTCLAYIESIKKPLVRCFLKLVVLSDECLQEWLGRFTVLSNQFHETVARPELVGLLGYQILAQNLD